MALNARQQAFVREYLRCGNAAEAYRLAGYRCANAETAAAGAKRLLRSAPIRSQIESARAEERRREAQAAAQDAVTREEVIRGLKTEAAGNPAAGRAADRILAWELLAKLMGLFKRAELAAEIDAMKAEDEGGPATQDPRNAAGQDRRGEAPRP